MPDKKMTNLFDSISNKNFFQWYAKSMHSRIVKRLDYLELENAKIMADEYQHNWLVCHELRLFGG